MPNCRRFDAEYEYNNNLIVLITLEIANFDT